MKKVLVIDEEGFKLRKEIGRIRKKIEDVIKEIETPETTETIKELFFKEDCDSYLLSEKERKFYDWIQEEYNPQITVFIETSEKEKRISKLFFLSALTEFIKQIKIRG